MCDHRFKEFVSLERRLQSCSFQLTSKFPPNKTIFSRILGGRSDARVDALDKWLRELVSMHGSFIPSPLIQINNTNSTSWVKNKAQWNRALTVAFVTIFELEKHIDPTFSVT